MKRRFTCWMIIAALLVLTFSPQALGVLMMMAGAGYVASSFTSLIVPRYEGVVGPYAMMLVMGELPIIFWLMIWGVTVPRSRGPESSSAPLSPS